ncbi:Arginase/deacetylase [Fistulina hepatica ATCC 64428]|uniref:Arginase/deacetylase n=1 Tax=Fistulina hepatica ATCC 64428 TaxID=1128425 RepID=A0A0D7ADW0_9AGAR|nr:Arginase/deacetylase [Fistulina hepatica ATCC 64428]
MFATAGLVILAAAIARAHQALLAEHPAVDITQEPWASKYGAQKDLGYTGPLSFSHMPYARCLEDASTPYDIAIIGLPFDTTTSYRPGARFGPFGIRSGSRRQSAGGYTLAWGASPYELGASILDCGDVPLTAYDNMKAIDQMEVAYDTLLMRPVKGGADGLYRSGTATMALDGKEHPRMVALGGDHTIVLPILRSLNKVYGPISVIHFDSHLGTRTPGASDQERITHGSYFTIAFEENLMTNRSIHGGIRQKLANIEAIDHDLVVGFHCISAEDIDDYGVQGIIDKLRERVGDTPVYLSLDIDVIDPAFAPATGTPEAGGWTLREMKRILRGLSGLNFVGADIVEVAPAYDHADITCIAAADLVHDLLTMMQLPSSPKPHGGPWAL